MNSDLKFIFFGTPEVSSKTLEILKQSGFIPTLIVTSTDKPQGRKMVLTPPPTKIWAIENNIEYIQPEKLNIEVIQKLKSFNSDLFIVVAYGKIMPEELIQSPKLGSINIHYSLLPKYRGASPVESAILKGEKTTGISIQQMEYKMDSGPILAEEKIDILPTETTEELRLRLIEKGGALLVDILPKLVKAEIKPEIQNELEATFCKKIKKEDGLVDPFNDDPTITYNKFRAYSKWPRIYYFKDGKRIIITDASIIEGKFVIQKVLPEGKKEISWEEFKKQN